jgi:hypothetical protein
MAIIKIIHFCRFEKRYKYAEICFPVNGLFGSLHNTLLIIYSIEFHISKRIEVVHLFQRYIAHPEGDKNQQKTKILFVTIFIYPDT